MIISLDGTLIDKQPPFVRLEVQGVGYEIDVPLSTFVALPGIGERVRLHTHLQVREDAHQLFGFATSEERDTFRTLIRANGVGPKLALALLSQLSVSELAAAVAAQDASKLTRTPGIGKKTAERLLLELKDKTFGTLPSTALPQKQAVLPAAAVAHPHDEALQALLGLGYSEREARGALQSQPEDQDLSITLRQALKALARAQ